MSTCETDLAMKSTAAPPLDLRSRCTGGILFTHRLPTNHPHITRSSPPPRRVDPAPRPIRPRRSCRHPRQATPSQRLRRRRDRTSRSARHHNSVTRRDAEGKVWLPRASRCRHRSVLHFLAMGSDGDGKGQADSATCKKEHLSDPFSNRPRIVLESSSNPSRKSTG